MYLGLSMSVCLYLSLPLSLCVRLPPSLSPSSPCLSLSLLLSPCLSLQITGAKDLQNIFMIVVDDLRPQIKSYGLDFMVTPHIDK